MTKPVQCVMRLADAARDVLTKEAKANHRSRSAEIVRRLSLEWPEGTLPGGMQSAPGEKYKRTVVWVPANLHRELLATASRNGRSLQSECAIRITHSLAVLDLPATSVEASAKITAWMPETSPITLAILGKLAEECNELAGRAVRSIIQGIDEIDPTSGRTNRDELRREIADVNACVATAREYFALDPMLRRQNDKRAGYLKWHDLITAQDREALDGRGEASSADK